MVIDSRFAQQTVVEAELRVLQFLCQETGASTTRQRAMKLLREHQFQDPLHHVVFATLCSFPVGQPNHNREALIKQLTLRGFPDVEVDPFFQPHDLTPKRVDAILAQLHIKTVRA